MFIMSYKGEIVNFDMSKFNNDEEMYRTMWKILYNIDIPKERLPVKIQGNKRLFREICHLNFHQLT